MTYARLDRRRRLVPEQLLDRVGEQRPVGEELRPLLRVPGEEHRRPAEEPGGRLAPRALQQDEEALHLHRFEPARGAVGEVDLDVEQQRDEVVLTLLPALLDEVGHVGAHLAAAFDPDLVELHDPLDGVAGLRVGVVVHEHVGPATELLLVLLGHAEHLADDHRRDPGRELAEEVELGASLEGVERLPAEPPEARLRAPRPCGG